MGHEHSCLAQTPPASGEEASSLSHMPPERASVAQVDASQQVSEERAKCIILDGPSTQNMNLANGMLRIKSLEFREKLIGVGNTRTLVRSPLYVGPPNMPRGVQSSLRNNGFELMLVTTAGSKDDQTIREFIREQSRHTISELVLVTANFQDYVQELLEKADEGIEVYVVATRKTHPDSGYRLLASDAEEFIQHQKHFHLVLLEDWKDDIMLMPFVPRAMVRRVSWTFRLPSYENSEIRTALRRRVNCFIEENGIRISTVQVEESRCVVFLEIPLEKSMESMFALAGSFIDEYDLEELQMRLGERVREPEDSPRRS